MITDLLFGLIYILTCLYAYQKLKKHKATLPINFITLSFLFHLAMAGLYCYMSIISPADSRGYYLNTLEMTQWFSLLNGDGTSFISFFLLPFSNWLHLSYFSCFLVFQTMGYIGIFLFYLALRETIYPSFKLRKLSNYMLFLPGLNYWTCAIGKDALFMFGIGAVLYALSKFSKRWKLFLVGCFFILNVRLHIFAVLVAAIGGGLLLGKNKLKPWMRMVLLIGIIAVALVGIRYVTNYIGLASLTPEQIKLALEFRQGLNLEGGSSVNISKYPFWLQIFTYIYRPLFFDAKNILMLLVSFENLIYFLFTIPLLTPVFLKYLKTERRFFVRFNIFFAIGAVSILALTTTNLGIAVRQKMMFMPSLFIIFFFFKYHLFLKRYKKRQLKLKLLSTYQN